MSGWGPRVHPLRPHGKPVWWSRCQTNARADPLANLFNCVLALREDPEWKDALGFDEMMQAAVLRGVAVADADVYSMHLWMQSVGIEKMPLEAVREAVEIVARERRFHPLRDWLEGLAWDGVPRLTDWLDIYLGVSSSEYHRDVGPRFLISMVARVFSPGCQCDYMLVLIGEQGEMKSKLCRALASDAYFSSHLPDLASDPVRLSMHLRGKWLIEVAELAAFSSNLVKAENLKAFITRPVEQYTPKHARKEVNEPRQCVLVGTHNEPQFLRDETGNRRFWPIICGVIDLDALLRDRDQLFAEAIDAYRRGAKWWPERAFEKQFIEPVQQQHLWEDAWAEPTEKFLTRTLNSALQAAAFPKVTVAEVARDALGIPDGKLDPGAQKRIQRVLRALKWQPGRTMHGRHWSPP
jgi:predicted P-loop ATPase